MEQTAKNYIIKRNKRIKHSLVTGIRVGGLEGTLDEVLVGMSVGSFDVGILPICSFEVGMEYVVVMPVGSFVGITGGV